MQEEEIVKGQGARRDSHLSRSPVCSKGSICLFVNLVCKGGVTKLDVDGGEVSLLPQILARRTMVSRAGYNHINIHGMTLPTVRCKLQFQNIRANYTKN